MDKYKIAFLLIFSGYFSVAQHDFGLVDSLIQNNQFPLAYPNHTKGLLINNLDSIGIKRLTFVLKENKQPKTFYYIIRKNDEIDSTYFSTNDTDVLNLHYKIDNISTIPLPEVHLAYFYPRIYKRKDKWYYNFKIDHYIKNWGDVNWKTNDYLVDVKVYDTKLNIVKESRFRGSSSKKSRNEGWVGTIFDGINYYPSHYEYRYNPKPKVNPWYHYSPNIYTYKIEVLNNNLNPYQTFVEKVGFRYIEEIDETIHINNKKAIFKSAQINPKNSFIDKEYLFDIKRNNFNTIILVGKANERVFDLCDSLGLLVVQEISNEAFGSLSDLLNYFMMAKDHPSFIMWKNNGFNPSSINILKRLDYTRPFYESKYNIQFRVIKNWDSLSIKEREKIKTQFQTIKFNFIINNPTLIIQLLEPFKLTNKLALKWKIWKKGNIVEKGTVGELGLTAKKETKLTIPFEKPYTLDEYTMYEFEVEFKVDTGIYYKGDIIAASKFRLVENSNNLNLVLERVY